MCVMVDRWTLLLIASEGKQSFPEIERDFALDCSHIQEWKRTAASISSRSWAISRLSTREDAEYILRFFFIEELNAMSDVLSGGRLIGEFQFKKVYRGSIGEHVTGKKWENPELYDCFEGEKNEVIFLKQTEVRSHPNLVKLVGYCCEVDDRLLTAHGMKLLNSVHNLVLEDWLQRIKVLLGFPPLPDALHSPDRSTSAYLLCSIGAAHILVDKDYNTILHDFTTTTSGIFLDWSEYPDTWTGCHSYTSLLHDGLGVEKNVRIGDVICEKLRESNYLEDSEYNLKSFSVEELSRMTDDFSEDKVIGDFQFGKVYRGSIGEQDVTVKKWEHPELYDCDDGDNELRQRNELIFLKQAKVGSHPNLVKLLGYCREGQDQLFMVYDMKPLNSLHNLVLEDSFTWLQRIKVLLGFACLIDFLHSADHPNSPYLLSNIDAAHILVDKDYNPILCDFGTISGGIFPDWSECSKTWTGCIGYTSLTHVRTGANEEEDIHAFGTLLLMLISKQVYPLDDLGGWDGLVHEWARNDYKSRRTSSLGFAKHCLVHKSLVKNQGYYSKDGLLISRLGFSCVAFGPSSGHPACMKQIVKMLLELQIVSDHREFLGIDHLECGV